MKHIFVEMMSREFCDMAGITFYSQREKIYFIHNTWFDYGDTIEDFINWQIGRNAFNYLNEEQKQIIVRKAIIENYRYIFDNSFNE